MQPYTALALLAVLLSVVNGGETQVELRTEKSLSSDCDNKATLNCTIISEHSDVIVLGLHWENKNGDKLCNYRTANGEQSDPRIQCDYTPNKQLSLTISKLSEDDRGQYICKLFTNFNHTKAATTLHVSECRLEPLEIMLGSYSEYNHASALQTQWTFLVLTAFLLTL